MERKPYTMDMQDNEEEEELRQGRRTLQGLLRRLGAGLEEVFHAGGSSAGGRDRGYGGSGGGNAATRAALAQIRTGDPGEQLEGLSEICDQLALCNEESLLAFPLDSAVPLLVQCLESDSPDVALLAARGLTFLADIPGLGVGALLRHRGAPALVSRLLAIEYIDVAEQALAALQKLASEAPGAVLRAGALPAVLSFIDFFPLSVQRAAAATAAMLCGALGADGEHAATAALPALLALLQSSDSAVAGSAASALSAATARLAVASRPALAALRDQGLISGLYGAVQARAGGEPAGPGAAPLAAPAFHSLVSALTVAARTLPDDVPAALLNAGALTCAAQLLDGSGGSGDATGGTPPPPPSSGAAEAGGTMSPRAAVGLGRSPEQLNSVVSWVVALLPEPSDDGDEEESDEEESDDEHNHEGDGDEDVASPGSSPRHLDNTSTHNHLAIPEDTVASLAGSLLSAAATSSSSVLTSTCLSALDRLLAAADPAAARAALLPLPVSSTLAGLARAGGSAESTRHVLTVAARVLRLLPKAAPAAFAREGLLHALSAVAGVVSDDADKAPESTTAPASTDRERAGATGSARPGTTTTQLERDNAARAALLLRRCRARAGATAESEAVAAIRAHASRLPDPAALDALLEVLSSGATLSTFELLSTGALDALCGYLAGTGLEREGLEARLLRLAAFVDAAGGGLPPIVTPSTGQTAYPTRAAALAAHAMTALEAMECLAVPQPLLPPAAGSWSVFGRRSALFGGGGSGLAASASEAAGAAGRLSAGLDALSTPINLRFVRCTGEEAALRDHDASVVAVVPLVTLAAVEDFLWPRVCRGSPDGAGGGVGERLAGGSRQQGGSQPDLERGRDAAAGASDDSNAAPQQGSRRRREGGNDGRTTLGRRLTRTQARAAAEAEVLAQGSHAAGAGNADARGTDDSGDDDEGAALQHDDSGMDWLTHGMDGADDDNDSDENEDSSDGEDSDGSSSSDDDVVDDHEHGLALPGGGTSDNETGADAEFAPVRSVSLDAPTGTAGAGSGSYGGPVALTGRGGAGLSAAAVARSAPAHAGLAGREALPSGTAGHATRSSTAAGTVAARVDAASAGSSSASSYASALTGTGAEPRLTFVYRGRALPRDVPLLRVLCKALSASAGGTEAGARLWGDVHRVQYRCWLPEDDEDGGEGRRRLQGVGEMQSDEDIVVDAPKSAAEAFPGAMSSSNSAQIPVALQPLLALDFARVPDDLAEALGRGGAAPAAAALLAALGELDARLPLLRAWVARYEAAGRPPGAGDDALVLDKTRPGSVPLQPSSSSPSSRLLPAGAVTSWRLAAKVSSALADVVAASAGLLPDWVVALGQPPLARLLPFDTRRLLFRMTALGPGRALLAAAAAVAGESGASTPRSAGGGEAARGMLSSSSATTAGSQASNAAAAAAARAARVPRHRVRLSRRRVVESAGKVFAMPGMTGASLEVEYHGEAGTGLGPTLEFYTLLAAELVGPRHAGLWMNGQADVARGGGTGGGLEAPKARETGDPSAAATSADAQRPAQHTRHHHHHHHHHGSHSHDNNNASRPRRRSSIGQLARQDAVALAAGGSAGPGSAPGGLFPAPLAPGFPAAAARCAVMHTAGAAAAKALQDGRLFDLPLAPLMWRRVLEGCEGSGGGRSSSTTNKSGDRPASPPPDLDDLATLDPALASGLRKLLAAAGSGCVDGVPLQDLCIPLHELPGYPGYQLAIDGSGKRGEALCPDDADEEAVVTVSTVKPYVAAVLDALLGSGVQRQIDAFRAGVEQFVPPAALAGFDPAELELLLCGEYMDEWAWTEEELRGWLHCDHGYTRSSTVIGWLVEVLAELDAKQRRAFLAFATGAPRLPPGGLAALRPPLTVVRKTAPGAGTGGVATGTRDAGPSPGSGIAASPRLASSLGSYDGSAEADADLPSVMTCANYIKLPPYSSKAMLRRRLLFVLAEGLGSFDLS